MPVAVADRTRQAAKSGIPSRSSAAGAGTLPWAPNGRTGAMDGWKSPVLIWHNDDDRNVEFSQTVNLVRRLRAQNVEFEQIIYPDEIHELLLHGDWLRAYHATADFFDKHLK